MVDIPCKSKNHLILGKIKATEKEAIGQQHGKLALLMIQARGYKNSENQLATDIPGEMMSLGYEESEVTEWLSNHFWIWWKNIPEDGK